MAGPPGVGKKALALAFAEAIHGVDHLSDLKGHAGTGTYYQYELSYNDIRGWLYYHNY